MTKTDQATSKKYASDRMTSDDDVFKLVLVFMALTSVVMVAFVSLAALVPA